MLWRLKSSLSLSLFLFLSLSFFLFHYVCFNKQKRCGLWSTDGKEDKRTGRCGCKDDQHKRDSARFSLCDANNVDKPQNWPEVWQLRDPQCNGRGQTFFTNKDHRRTWLDLGTRNGGMCRKCQPNCGCGYGSGHSKWVFSSGQKNQKLKL